MKNSSYPLLPSSSSLPSASQSSSSSYPPQSKSFSYPQRQRQSQPQLQLQLQPQPQPYRPSSYLYPQLYPHQTSLYNENRMYHPSQHQPHPQHTPYNPMIRSTDHYHHHNPSIGTDYQHPVYHPHSPVNPAIGSTQPHHSPISSYSPSPVRYPPHPHPPHPPHNPEIGSTYSQQYHYHKNEPKDSLVVTSTAIEKDWSSSLSSESTSCSTTESTSISNETDSQKQEDYFPFPDIVPEVLKSS